ncbi:alpha/beta hydrolase fold domain-containing protein, partial [Bifidobacterium sp. SO4]|uniref:alpha/beta hydrolase n=1 Tax=Bifidobacterium sp. SO4 TaxID=2809030 RepID=UPI001BDCA472
MTLTRQDLKADSPQMRGAVAFLAKIRDLGGMMNMREIFPKLTDAERAYMAPSQADENAVDITSDTVDGIGMELLEPKTGKRPGVLYYIHGGAFMYGDAELSRPIAIDLAKVTGLTVCTVSYRLMPKDPFPAAVDDCTAVYRWLAGRFAGEPIVIAGDSAGGNLTMVMALEGKRLGLPRPAALVTYSLVGDFTGLPSWTENEG